MAKCGSGSAGRHITEGNRATSAAPARGAVAGAGAGAAYTIGACFCSNSAVVSNPLGDGVTMALDRNLLGFQKTKCARKPL
jgi:hypothetical protein